MDFEVEGKTRRHVMAQMGELCLGSLSRLWERAGEREILCT
jgi:hypothetical protein